MGRIQQDGSWTLLRAVTTALVVYAVVLQMLLPLSVSLFDADRPGPICTLSGGVAGPDAPGSSPFGHDCLSCCLVFASAAVPEPTTTPEPLRLAFYVAASLVALASGPVLSPGSGWPPAPRSPPVSLS